MPKRTDIKSVLIIGAGPIIIGQACEFDYSGAQACKALREEGYRVILVNSNPATIMTDPQTADVVGRTCETKNGTYFYYVNLTDRPQRAKSPYWFYLDLSSDETVFGKTVWLKPYELRSFLKR